MTHLCETPTQPRRARQGARRVLISLLTLAAALAVFAASPVEAAFATAPSVPTPVNDGYSADVNWRASTTLLEGSWGASVDPQNSLDHYNYCYSTTPNFTGCFGPVTPTGTTTTATQVSDGGLSLTNYTTYYVCVNAQNTLLETSAVACSNGVKPDTAPPAAPVTINDGAAADVSYARTTPIQGNWTASVDGGGSGVGMQNYDWCIAPNTSCTGALDFGTTTGTTASTPNAPASGTTYYVCVKPRDLLGNVQASYTCSNGQQFDNVQPSQPLVKDGPTPSVDIDWQTASNTQVQLTWNASSDPAPGSGWNRYEYCVATSATCTTGVVQTWTSTAATSATVTAALVEGTKYYSCVRSYDNAGNFNVHCSNGQTVDLVPPNAPTWVNDGTAADLTWTMQSPARLQANWATVSDAGGFDHYQVCFTTSSSGADCLAGATMTWTDTTATNYTKNGLALVHNTAYYACLRSWDKAGHVSTGGTAVTCSNGTTIDANNPPTPATVTDSTGFPVLYTPSATNLAGTWAGITDDLSGLLRYEHCFTTTANGSDCSGAATVPWTTSGTSTNTNDTPLVLSNGVKYTLCVRVFDNAGNASTVSCSLGQTVDTAAPPLPANVKDGAAAGVDSAYSKSQTLQSANWPAVTDALSGVDHYSYCVTGSATGADCATTAALPWTSTSPGTTASFTDATTPALAEGSTNYTCVRVTDQVNNVTAVRCSNGFRIDTVAPGVPASVNDGTGADVDSLASPTTVSANWPAATDATAGIASYDYCITTSSSGADCAGAATVAWTDNAAATTVTRSGLTLAPGNTYYVCVRTHDNATWLSASSVCSNGATLNVTPPAAVRDGSAADIDGTTSATTLEANWDSVSASGLNHYDYCMTTSATGADCAGAATVAWTSAALTTSVSRAGLSLAADTRYYTCVRSVDNQSIPSGARCSDGQVSDSSAPTAPTTVNDGAGSDRTWIAGTPSGNWSGASDASALTYRYCVTMDPAGADCAAGATVPWTATASGGTATSFTNATTLTENMLYYVCVETTDSVGHLAATSPCSNGATVDVTAPVATTAVRDGAAAPDLDFAKTLAHLSANWNTVVDASGSTLDHYDYCISTVTACGGTPVVGWTSAAATTSMDEPALTLAEATKYVTCVRAVDVAGNRSPVTCSNGLTTDNVAPPAPPAVRDGAGSDIAFQNATGSARANWTPPTDSGSGTAGYEYCVTLTADCTGSPLVAWTAVTPAQVTHTGLSLSNGMKVTVCVRALDAVGNRGTGTCSNGATVYATQPAIVPSAPGQWASTVANRALNKMSFALDGGPAGIASATGTFLGKTLPVSGGIVDLSGAPEGRGSFTLTVTDVAGNVSTFTQDLTVDFTPPQVLVKMAKLQCVVSKAGVQVCTKSKKLMPQPIVTKTAVATVQLTDAVSGPAVPSVRLLKLKPGRNLVKVTLADKAGNTAVQTVLVYRLSH